MKLGLDIVGIQERPAVDIHAWQFLSDRSVCVGEHGRALGLFFFFLAEEKLVRHVSGQMSERLRVRVSSWQAVV